MLNFSKIKILLIYLSFLAVSFFCFSNISDSNNFFLKKKINLGLDLQGGSYLLLEVDSTPLQKRQIQSKVIPLKKKLIENKINYKNFKIKENVILFEINTNDKEKIRVWKRNGGKIWSFNYEVEVLSQIKTYSSEEFNGLIRHRNKILNPIFMPRNPCTRIEEVGEDRDAIWNDVMNTHKIVK